MTNALLLFVVVTGIASQYAPGVMQEVIAVRQAGRTSYSLPANLPDVDGYIALLEPDLIGQIVYVRPVGTHPWRSMLVVDCAGHADGGHRWMLRNGIIAEVDHQTAKAWGTLGRGIEIELLYPELIKTEVGVHQWN